MAPSSASRASSCAPIAQNFATAVAQAEHGELEFVEFRRAFGSEEFDQAACVVRRIAFALRGYHDVEQAFVFQIAQRIGVGTQQARREAGVFRIACERFGEPLGVAGLAAEYDRQLLVGGTFHRDQRRSLVRGRERMRGRKPRGVAGQPIQRGGIQPIDEARQQPGFVFGQRDQGMDRFGGHGIWTSKWMRAC